MENSFKKVFIHIKNKNKNKEFAKNLALNNKTPKLFPLFISWKQEKNRWNRNFMPKRQVEKPIIDDLAFNGSICCVWYDARILVFRLISAQPCRMVWGE